MLYYALISLLLSVVAAALGRQESLRSRRRFPGSYSWLESRS
jgi:hypothetical protein